MFELNLSRDLANWVEAERQGSAISSEVWRLNIQVLAGWQAPAEFLAESIAARQRDQNYVSADGRRLLQRYKHLEDGCWITWGEALDNRPLVPYAKPFRPRTGADGKVIKYENPPRLSGYPVLPLMPGRTWRDIASDPGIPIGIVEGAKKALALVSHGLPTVAIRGVTMWHPGGQKEPWPELVELAKGGRTIYLFPDQDEKPRTRSDVLGQNRKLGRALERHGAKVRVVTWDPALGKGADDVLARYGQAWLDRALAGASSLDELARAATVAKARVVLARLREALRPQIVQPGGFVASVQPLRGGILWLDAPMGSGKTQALGQTARRWIADGGQVLVLSPLNSLGRQTAERFGLPHIHDYAPEQASLLHADVTVRGGLVGCLNSAERLAAALDPRRPLLVVLDEANQVLADAAAGGTLRDRWSAKLAVIGALLQRAEAVIAAEAGIWGETVELLQALKGDGTPAVGYRVEGRGGATWQTVTYTQPGGWRAEVAARLLQGQRLLLVTTSQREGRRWHRWAVQHGIPAERIDSETAPEYAEFFRDPNAWVASTPHQLLIMSPTAKTGLSIEAGDYDAVVGALPNLDTDTAMQLLGRYRRPVPRLVWRPAWIMPEPDEEPNPLRVWGALAREVSVYGASMDRAGPWTRFYVAMGRRRWAQKVAALASLGWALEAAGHTVEPGNAQPCPDLDAEFRGIDESLRLEDADTDAALRVDPQTHTLEWARDTLEGLDAGHMERRRARKVILRHEFPCVNWDVPRVWQAAVHGRHPLRRKAQRWVGACFARAKLERDTQTRSQLQADPCPVHLVRRDVFDWALAARFRPLLLPIVRAGVVTPDGEAERRVVELALQLQDEIWRYWRLQVNAQQSTTAIVNKILKKFGIAAVRHRCVQVGGRRGWVYLLVLPEFWVELVAAFRQRLVDDGLAPTDEVWIPQLPVAPQDGRRHAPPS